MPVFEIVDSDVVIELVIRPARSSDAGGDCIGNNSGSKPNAVSTAKEEVVKKPEAKPAAHPTKKILSHKPSSSIARSIEPSSTIMDQLMKKYPMNTTVNAYTYQDREDILWNKQYHELVEYKRKHGNLSVPLNYNGSKTLNKWVSIRFFSLGFFLQHCNVHTA